MAKSPGSHGRLPAPKASSAKLGSGSKGRTNNVKAGKGGYSQPLVAPLRPAESGAADVVQQRKAVATQGTMEHKQLKRNQSTGLGALGKLRASPKGKK